MTEAQIESRVARMTDEVDRQYLTTPMTEDSYKARLKQIDDWAWMQQYSARLSNGWRTVES